MYRLKQLLGDVWISFPYFYNTKIGLSRKLFI